jgi:hypothetical protein
MATSSKSSSIALAVLLIAFGVATRSLNAEQLPVTHAKTLSGREITLPVPDHPRTFLAVGFSKASSEAVKAWWLQAEPICRAHPDVACYEAAVIEDAPSFVRGMIVSGMKRGMDPDRQNTFVTIVENESAWKEAVGFSAPDDAYLAIFDAAGKLLWRTTGPGTAANSTAIAKGFDTTSK